MFSNSNLHQNLLCLCLCCSLRLGNSPFLLIPYHFTSGYWNSSCSLKSNSSSNKMPSLRKAVLSIPSQHELFLSLESHLFISFCLCNRVNFTVLISCTTWKVLLGRSCYFSFNSIFGLAEVLIIEALCNYFKGGCMHGRKEQKIPYPIPLAQVLF